MKILIAEDDVLTRRLLEANLARWGYDVVLTGDGLQADQMLQEVGAARLAILDWMMPGMDGLEVCRRLRARGSQPYLYVLLLTTRDGKHDIIEGLEAGADDYLTKPFDSSELKARLGAGRRIIELQDQLIAAREELRIQATHDALTGLWNRGAILDILERELKRGERDGSSTGVILCDIDFFKQINDTYGHLAGDSVLREAARRMTATVRPYDAVGRYGGEEFLFVLTDCDLPSTTNLARRLREIMEAEPVRLDEGAIKLTMSLGVTATDPKRSLDADRLLRSADAALYRAKKAGRNRVEVGDSTG